VTEDTVTEDRLPRWVDLEQRYPRSPIHSSLGLTLEVVAAGDVRIHYDGTPGAANTVGNPSGALLAAMVDSAVMQAVLTRLEPDDHTTTLELKINYLRGSAPGGSLVGRGRLEHLGRTTAVGIARIADASDKVVAVGIVTASVRRA
jgi:uncharacterized protein (TIGR00369 family)